MEVDASTPGELLQAAASVWQWLLAFLNSNFSAALFGAGLGAWTAYWLARRGKRFDDTVQEIRHCNEGLIAAWNICNSAMVLRKQHVRALKENFDSSERLLKAHKEGIKAGTVPPDQPFHFVADYRKLPPFTATYSNLQRAGEGVSLGGKSTMIAYTIAQSVDQLNLLISEHNRLLAYFEANSGIDDARKVARHFGFKIGDVIDTRYRDMVDGLAATTDDCIWFSAKLSDAFTARGKELKGKDKRLPNVQGVKLPEGELPDDNNYSGFL